MPKDKLISYNDDLYYQGQSVTKIPNKDDISKYDTSTLVYFKQTYNVTINEKADLTHDIKSKQYDLIYNLHQNIKPIYFTITNISCTGTVRSSISYNSVFINFGAINENNTVYPLLQNIQIASLRYEDSDMNIDGNYSGYASCIYNVYDTYFMRYTINNDILTFENSSVYLPMIYVLLSCTKGSVITPNFVLSYTLSICGTTIA